MVDVCYGDVEGCNKKDRILKQYFTIMGIGRSREVMGKTVFIVETKHPNVYKHNNEKISHILFFDRFADQKGQKDLQMQSYWWCAGMGI